MSHHLHLLTAEPERQAIDVAAVQALARLFEAAAPTTPVVVEYQKEIGPGAARLRHVSRSADLMTELMRLCDVAQLDYGFIPADRTLSDFGVLAMDMDSTLITIECIDEIADYCGKKEAVAAITAAAMRGEITDYNQSLQQRVALLRDLPTTALDAVYAERLRLTAGAEVLLQHAQKHGLKTLLVSGGFTYFTSRLQQRLHLDRTRANQLGIEHERLTGEVLGEIVNASVKKREVLRYCEELGIAPAAAIVIGDGANDLEMMSIAGLSVAHHAKPVVRAQVDVSLSWGGLDQVVRMLSS